MPGIFYLLLMSIIAFGSVILMRKLWGKDGVFVIAIGCLTGANFYNVNSYGIELWGMIVGVDAIVYTCFIYCLIILKQDYGDKPANSLLYSSIVALIFAALIDFIAKWATAGLDNNVIWGLISYLISALATWLAVFTVFKLIDFLQKKNCNKYLVIILALVIASLINSTVYLGLLALLPSGIDDNFAITLLGSYFSKLIALIFTIITVAIFEVMKKKNWIKQCPKSQPDTNTPPPPDVAVPANTQNLEVPQTTSQSNKKPQKRENSTQKQDKSA